MTEDEKELPKRVKVPAFTTNGGGDFPATTVDIIAGRVTLADGTLLGFVRRDFYRHSPPTHKGSRIAKYHKKVPEWQATTTPGGWLNGYRGGGLTGGNSRRAALAYLIARHHGIANPYPVFRAA